MVHSRGQSEKSPTSCLSGELALEYERALLSSERLYMAVSLKREECRVRMELQIAS